MKSSNYGLWALAAAIVFVGALVADVKLDALLPLLIVLACPLMMLFMMKGMHGGDGHQHTGHQQDDHDEHPTPR